MAASAPALGLNTIIFKYVYWYMKQISGERLQDHWSSGFSYFCAKHRLWVFTEALNKYPQSIFLSKDRKIVYPVYPSCNI